VSQPWSVNRTRCGENRPPFDDDATDEQERRASARRVFGRSNDVRDFSQITCKCVPHTTAGLRQPLLTAPRPFGAEYDIWDVQTHVHKRGGRQPAVVGKPNAVRRKSPTIQRRCDGRTRAAGVSPPSSVNRTRCGENRPPFNDDATDAPKSGGRQPAVVFGRSNDVRDFSQITCKCVPHITAGLRQPLLIAPRPFGAEYDIWDVQTHLHKRGGRQPAVRFGKRTGRVG
jgi:hypothetical protein